MVETSNPYGTRTLLDDINDELHLLNTLRDRIWARGFGLNTFGKKIASVWYQSGYGKTDFLTMAKAHGNKKVMAQVDKIWDNKGLLPEKK